MLRIERLERCFGGARILAGVSCSFEEGRAYALIGPNGSGKTTLLNIVSGYLKPNRGNVFFKGARVIGKSPSELARSGMARSFQSVKLFRSLTVADNLLIALRGKPDESLWNAAIGKHASSIPVWGERVDALIEEFHLTDVRAHAASDLSFGQQKLLHLAMALANPSQLLLLDEPVGSLQSKFVEQISDKLSGLKQTILIVEHNLDFVRQLASEILFLGGGRIIARGKFDDVMADPRVRESYL